VPNGAHDYTGGQATCDAEGDGYVETACEWCGDGEVNGADEVCDGSVEAGTTCEDVGFPGDTDTVSSCKNDCTFDTSMCSICDAGYAAANKCLGENPAGTGCNGGACSNAQCGTGETCAMACDSWNTACTAMSCNDGATCNFTCTQNQTCSPACQPGSSCNMNATWNTLPAGTLNCADGDTCTWTFETNPATVIDATMRCETGATCTAEQKAYNAALKTLICEAGSTCDMKCSGGGGGSVCTYQCLGDADCTCTATNGASCVELP